MPDVVKRVFFDPACAFAVFELPEDQPVPTDEEIVRITTKMEQSTGLKTVVIPHGASVKVLPNGGVYHRERVGDYEIEIVARTEEGLKARLEHAAW